MSTKYLFLLFLGVFAFIPSPVGATAIHYTCSDLDISGGLTCFADVITRPSGGSPFLSTDLVAGLLDNTTYYLYFESDDSVTFNLGPSGNAVFCGNSAESASVGGNEYPFTTCTQGDDDGWVNLSSFSGADWNWSNFCISDSAGECASPPPSGGGDGTFFDWEPVTTTTATVSTPPGILVTNCYALRLLTGAGIGSVEGLAMQQGTVNGGVPTASGGTYTRGYIDYQTGGDFCDAADFITGFDVTNSPDGIYDISIYGLDHGGTINTGIVGVIEYEITGGVMGSPSEAPLSDNFNEVDHYIPTVGVATTTGTTTVGAVFAMNQPWLVDYIGYRIISPNNEVVYNATSTVSLAALYEISTDFNFTTTGIYTGHAYFAQNGWETDNTTIQQIAINLTDWTVNPDGSFTQNPATTSTTTLPNLSLDCGTGFAGSICNLAAKLLLPDASSIQNVQSTWALLMNDAPFSFFTQSKALLGALKGTVGAQQTLSVTFFGRTTQIISASTTASIGFGEASLAFAKFIMTAGLWIMFAWFIYWRVGTIFHIV